MGSRAPPSTEPARMGLGDLAPPSPLSRPGRGWGTSPLSRPGRCCVGSRAPQSTEPAQTVLGDLGHPQSTELARMGLGGLAPPVYLAAELAWTVLGDLAPSASTVWARQCRGPRISSTLSPRGPCERRG
ncbi:hypothetical protein GH733_016277 [Mirounga leonina]|nr:hypothetical protein GH733_016277 [Mirounga leonina]